MRGQIARRSLDPKREMVDVAGCQLEQAQEQQTRLRPPGPHVPSDAPLETRNEAADDGSPEDD
eukprot:582697-Hanusia_phi.AAC.1